MNGPRFDDFVRQVVGVAAGRRQAIRGMMAAFLGTGLALQRPGGSDAHDHQSQSRRSSSSGGFDSDQLAAAKEVVLRFVDSWNRQDLQAAYSLWDPDVTGHSPVPGFHDEHSVSEMEKTIETFSRAFPNLNNHIEEIVADTVVSPIHPEQGPLASVVTTGIVTATLAEEFLGARPTGKPISWGTIDVTHLRFKEVGAGAIPFIVHHYGIVDIVAIVEQLGVRDPDAYVQLRQFLFGMSGMVIEPWGNEDANQAPPSAIESGTPSATPEPSEGQ